MEIEVLPVPEGNVIARGSYYGGPDYEFIVGDDGQVYFRVVGDAETVWAGPDAESFRRITAAWRRYRAEAPTLTGESAQRELVSRMRREFTQLGALPTDLPPDPEPLWSLLLFEAEHGLG
jgi:hypothetical protein